MWTQKRESYLYLAIDEIRDDNGSGRTRIVPTRNPTRQKKICPLSTRYSPGIRLKNTRGYF